MRERDNLLIFNAMEDYVVLNILHITMCRRINTTGSQSQRGNLLKVPWFLLPLASESAIAAGCGHQRRAHNQLEEAFILFLLRYKKAHAT
jgi:hypothetical protein